MDEWLFSDQYRETVEAIRAEENKARRDKLKAGLPAITPSGTFSYRNKSWLILHSNLICIDIDQKDNPGIGNFSAIKDTLADNASLYYTGLSASGNGLFVLFRIAYSERHAEHYHALVADLEDIGLIADLTCSDVSRLRGASYDPEPYYNPMAVPYEKLIYPPTISVTSTKWQNPSLTAYRVERIVERIREDSVNIAEHYRDWYDIGRSLAAEFGEYGRQWYHAISRQSSKYNPTECSIQYAHCLKTCSRTSIATFFGICKRHGLYA
ncbi:MAG: PriCT-2 domain-containing protein, partial [Bacteroidetes bacterium]|nr:PriCT-2 domain-containing protein [Bacteroidota bacterium]